MNQHDHKGYELITTYLTSCYMGHSFRIINDPIEIPNIKELSKYEGVPLALEGPFVSNRDVHYFINKSFKAGGPVATKKKWFLGLF